MRQSHFYFSRLSEYGSQALDDLDSMPLDRFLVARVSERCVRHSYQVVGRRFNSCPANYRPEGLKRLCPMAFGMPTDSKSPSFLEDGLYVI
jgi:hypothetical protein